MQLDKAIQDRLSVRKFLDKKPDWRIIIECINASRYAPMAGGNFSLKVIMIDDQEKIQQIAKAAQQDFISRAHYLVVFCSDKGRTTNAYGKRGEIYARQQAGAAIQNFWLKIVEADLGACWVGHFHEGQVKRTLKIPEEVDVEAIFPVGKKAIAHGEKEKPSRKIELDRFLYFNEYKNKRMKAPRNIKH